MGYIFTHGKNVNIKIVFLIQVFIFVRGFAIF